MESLGEGKKNRNKVLKVHYLFKLKESTEKPAMKNV